MSMTHARRVAVIAAFATAAMPLVATTSAQAAAPTKSSPNARQLRSIGDHALTPRTHFTMKADGSSGKTQGGEGIPNIDIVKSTIRTYYNATDDGIANKKHSPYIREMHSIVAKQKRSLRHLYRQAKRDGKKPAIVLDADDTTLMTYDMEDGAMHFHFDPTVQDQDWVQKERFPATPGMVDFVNTAHKMGFTIFGLTGRNDDQKTATLGNLKKVGYHGFTRRHYFTKWTGEPGSAQPSYIHCAVKNECTTVEYKAGTRRHIEKMGYDIALNIGDQWSDLMGGAADHYLKLPNPTYYLPSPDLPGWHEPKMSPRTHFTMKADGSSGKTQGGEGIPNIDIVKSTIRTYYNANSDGIANKKHSPYIREMKHLTRAATPILRAACSMGRFFGLNPAIVLDADDTTLMTYDMEDGAMHFHFDPVVQDQDWVQKERFPATPGMVHLVNTAEKSGCTLIGLTGRNDDQKTATLGNLKKVGYHGFTSKNYYTKWTGEGDSRRPSYIHCAEAKCTTIEYKSQTRAHVESRSGGNYLIVGNFGDQFSDLIGGHAVAPVKLPNPTYYLP